MVVDESSGSSELWANGPPNVKSVESIAPPPGYAFTASDFDEIRDTHVNIARVTVPRACYKTNIVSVTVPRACRQVNTVCVTVTQRPGKANMAGVTVPEDRGRSNIVGARRENAIWPEEKALLELRGVLPAGEISFPRLQGASWMADIGRSTGPAGVWIASPASRRAETSGTADGTVSEPDYAEGRSRPLVDVENPRPSRRARTGSPGFRRRLGAG